MCKFLSLISDGQGNIKYFDYSIRQRIISGELKGYETDSHQSLCDYFGKRGMNVSPKLVTQDNTWNWYEYNPFTKMLDKDKINLTDDFDLVLEKCKALDFSSIVPELIIKPIINPLETKRKRQKPTKKEIDLLKKWISVWDSVRASVVDSVRASVVDSVRASVWDFVGASVWDSVGDSVVDSVGTYISSFFNLKQWKGFENLPEGVNPFKSCIDLWEAGLVPSFDGKTWRLHAGTKTEVVFEIDNAEI